LSRGRGGPSWPGDLGGGARARWSLGGHAAAGGGPPPGGPPGGGGGGPAAARGAHDGVGQLGWRCWATEAEQARGSVEGGPRALGGLARAGRKAELG
jgi:hypothetical protein